MAVDKSSFLPENLRWTTITWIAPFDPERVFHVDEAAMMAWLKEREKHRRIFVGLSHPLEVAVAVEVSLVVPPQEETVP